MTSKLATELTPADLEHAAVWELAHARNSDLHEAAVKPRPRLKEIDPDRGNFLVRARFIAADGTAYVGLLQADERRRLHLMRPVVVTERGHVDLVYSYEEPAPDELAAAYATLDKQAEALFPLRFETEVAVAHPKPSPLAFDKKEPEPPEPISGELGGFAYFETVRGGAQPKELT